MRFTRHPQRLAAGGDDRELRAPFERNLRDVCAGAEQVFAVVQDQERSSRGQPRDDHVLGGSHSAEFQSGDHRAGHLAWILHRRQVDPPDRPRPEPLTCSDQFDGKPGLARSAWPGEGNHAGAGE